MTIRSPQNDGSQDHFSKLRFPVGVVAGDDYLEDVSVGRNARADNNLASIRDKIDINPTRYASP